MSERFKVVLIYRNKELVSRMFNNKVEADRYASRYIGKCVCVALGRPEELKKMGV